MSRVLTFSRTFPAYHPNAGQPTYFVEKIWNSFNANAFGETFLMDYSSEIKNELNKYHPYEIISDFIESTNHSKREDLGAKHHTIRAGNRWKVGQCFSPRVWSDKPYNSKQIVIAPDIEVKKVWGIEIDDYEAFVDGEYFGNTHSLKCRQYFEHMAKNDGLSYQDMMDWFRIPCRFSGQVICWSEDINY